MESLYFLIPLFFILLIILPFYFKVKVCLNMQKQNGAISIHLFKIRLLLIRFKLQNQNIVIRKKKRKQEMEFQLSEKQVRFLQQFMVQIKDKIRIKYLHSFSKIGVSDALQTALINGAINSLISVAFAYIKNNKPHVSIYVCSFPAFNRNVFVITAESKLSITILDIIYAVIMSLIIIKRSEVYERS